MTRRFNAFILVAIFLIGMPVYWLLFENQPGNASAEPVTIPDLRETAARLGGPLPARIEYELIASRHLQRNRFAAGTGFKPTEQQVVSYRIVYPDGASIIIDTGMTEWQARKAEYDDFDKAAQTRIFEAIAQASHVVILASGIAHIGGLEAIETWGREKPGGTILAGQTVRTDPYAIAPGVVIIPAGTLGNGARLVYARTMTGKEFLFAGAVSNIDLNWKGIRAPARLETDFGERQDREAIHSWLIAIRKISGQAPGLIVVSRNSPPRDAGFFRHFALAKKSAQSTGK